VTLTFPVNGKFSAPQEAVYRIVLEAQLAAIGATRPGATLEQIHEQALDVIVDGLLAIGLLTDDRQKILDEQLYKPFYMHRTSHWLGMDVHDVGSYFVDGESKPTARPLEPGQVLTVEPGIYVGSTTKAPDEYKGIGVRIEDDVLVTADGPDVMTRGIPKSVDDVERALASR